MAQDIVRAAQERLKAIKDTINSLEKQLADAHAERNDLQTFLRTYERLSRERLSRPTPPTVAALTEGLGKAAQNLAEVETSETLRTALMARKIIEEEGKPIRLTDLYNRVTATGMTFGGRNPVNTFAARLSNMRDRVRLISLSGVGWWLAERPWPAADYLGNTTGPDAQTSDPEE